VIGRDFAESDEAYGAAPVAMLNFSFWERRFGKDPAIVGRTIRLDGVATEVIGVMPLGFTFPQKLELWVPLVRTPQVMTRERRETWMAVARMRDGVTIESARAEMDAIGKRLGELYPKTDRENPPEVWNFPQFFLGPDAPLIYGSMWGAVGFVLLIACANLANLLLARAMGRSREISVRIALGAGRRRIVRQLLIESVALAGVGGFLGWWIAKLGVGAYQAAMQYRASWLVIDYSMDQRVVWYLIVVSIVTGILFGLAPALRLSRLDVNSALKDGARGTAGGVRGRHLSALLVTGEMALAVVLLAGAGVLIRSFLKIHSARMGVSTANVTIGLTDLPQARYPTPESQRTFYDRLSERLAATPGIEAVATADALPSTGAIYRRWEYVGGPPVTPEDAPRSAMMITVKTTPSYFRTLGAAVVAGREFNDTDLAGAPPVAIVNRTFVSRYWPGEEPLGKRVRFYTGNVAGAWMTVVGVAPDIIQNDQTRQRVDPVVYTPYRQAPRTAEWIFLRGRGDVARALRSEVKALDPDLPIFGPFGLDERLERFWDSRFYGEIFLIFAGVALLLAAVGLYTMVAHSVNQRTQEIGIRMAVGGSTGDILRLVLRQGLMPVGIGLAIGLTGSLAVNRVLKSALVSVSPSDPLTLAAAAGVLIFAAILGCLIPARRAMHVDPVVALRNE
jgi:predicted permease